MKDLGSCLWQFLQVWVDMNKCPAASVFALPFMSVGSSLKILSMYSYMDIFILPFVVQCSFIPRCSSTLLHVVVRAISFPNLFLSCDIISSMTFWSMCDIFRSFTCHMIYCYNFCRHWQDGPVISYYMLVGVQAQKNNCLVHCQQDVV